MCGIIGFTGKTSASKMLLDGLEKLEYRGYDSAGVALLCDGEFSVFKTVSRIKDLRGTVSNDFDSNIGIGHTRWATHGAPSLENAHPHISCDKKIAVVHNGIIENYLQLRNELEGDGVVFKSETDTEVIPNLIAKYYDGDLFDAVLKTVNRLKGAYALGVISTQHPDTLIAVKKFSPLIVGLGENENYIASDITALVSRTKKAIYLDDDELAVITPQNVKIYNSKGVTVNKKPTVIDWDITSAEKGGYAHFMMKEIMEQPKAVRETVQHRIKDGMPFFDEIKLNAQKLKSIDKISIVACGSAYHAGMVGKYVLEQLLKIPVEIDVASEFRYRNPIVNEKTLAVVISQSGETADTLAALRKAKKCGAYTLSVVNVVGSSIANASDDVLYTMAGPEIAVATTKGYSTQIALLYLFAVWAADILKTAELKELKEITVQISALPSKIEACLEQKDKISKMAKRSAEAQSIFFIGRNIDYAVSLEASLKLKEISYIHSEAYAAGELKHGTISLIEKGTPVMALSCYEPLLEKMMSNIKEVKARGAFVVACVDQNNKNMVTEADSVIFVPKTHNLLYASLEVIPFQLYAYYAAVYKNCDVDKPRNLAKSVTVE